MGTIAQRLHREDSIGYESPSEFSSIAIITMVKGRIISKPPDLRYIYSCVLVVVLFTLTAHLVRSPPHHMETHEH